MLCGAKLRVMFFLLQIVSTAIHVIQRVAYSILMCGINPDRLPSYFLFQSHSCSDDSDVSTVT